MTTAKKATSTSDQKIRHVFLEPHRIERVLMAGAFWLDVGDNVEWVLASKDGKSKPFNFLRWDDRGDGGPIEVMVISNHILGYQLRK